MYVLFSRHFPETAERETCVMSISPGNHSGLPVGEYAILEMYCDDPGCDCHRVRLLVVQHGDVEPLGGVDYGLETPAFYNRLLGGGQKAEAKRLAGITVDPSMPPSKYETAIRTLIAEWVAIPHILANLKRHYQMVRDHVDGVHPSTEHHVSAPSPKPAKSPRKRTSDKSASCTSDRATERTVSRKAAGRTSQSARRKSTGDVVSDAPTPLVMGPLAVRVRGVMLREMLKRSGLSIPKAAQASLSELLITQPEPGPAGVSSWDAYVHGQQRSMEFFGGVSTLPALKRYAKTVDDTMDRYQPEGPSVSPLTDSFFWTWAFYDLPIDDSGECLADCQLALSDMFGYTKQDCEVFRNMKSGRMSICEHIGRKRGIVRLRELLTDQECECRSMSEYPGTKGELWYVRLCPPISESHEVEHLTLTTPYILTGASKSDWEDYLRRVMPHARPFGDHPPLHCLLKYGLSNAPFHWHDFIWNAYSSHIREAITLTGLPDIPDSMPHQSDQIFRK